jgi:hypothetical protein
MRHRVRVLLLACALIAAPAVVLRAVCAGRSCEHEARAAPAVPFCSLDEDVRTLIADGFRDGRSPEVLAVATEPGVVGGSGFERAIAPEWPSAELASRARVPVLFFGPGISAGGLPDGFSLDDVAPTLADILELRRPHPEVRSGRPAEGLWQGEAPRLAIEVVFKGVGRDDLEERPEAWPYLEHLMGRGRAAPAAPTGSLPLDPAATLTTIGTGGLPRQHGITGTLIRNDDGVLTKAWGQGAPTSVIATLADDLDQRWRQRSRIGLVATASEDRGVIGGRWYIDVDRDDAVYVRGGAGEAAAALLAKGYGRDEIPDLLAAVVTSGRAAVLDDTLRRVVSAASRASDGSYVVVVTATGSAPRAPAASGRARPAKHGAAAPVPASVVVRRVERAIHGPPGIIEAAAAGGLFVNQGVAARRSISEDAVLNALGALRVGGRAVFADRFPAIAVSFGRYC